jgi:dTDP-4-amino-4,6-dideoxygalactose transaminase
MTDIQGAVGREQLKRLPEIVAQRRTLAARYHEALHGVRGIQIPFEPDWARSNWQSYAIRLEGHDQHEVMQRLLDAGVSTRRGVMNAHREPAYGSGWRQAPSGLTRSERAQDTAIMLPIFHEMTEADQMRVVRALEAALRDA